MHHKSWAIKFCSEKLWSNANVAPDLLNALKQKHSGNNFESQNFLQSTTYICINNLMVRLREGGKKRGS